MTAHSKQRRTPSDAPRYQNKRRLTLLQELRLAQGKEQHEIGDEVGADGSTVSLWETYGREPRPGFRNAYSKALGITVGELGRIIYQHAAPVLRRKSRDRAAAK